MPVVADKPKDRSPLSRDRLDPADVGRFSLFDFPRTFDPHDPEFVDREDTPAETIRAELRLLESTNRRLGIHRLILRSIDRILERHSPATLRVLDLATGAADVPRAIVSAARERGIPIEVTAIDINPVAIELARESCDGFPEIQIEQQDARDLSFEQDASDIVTCSASLHHFSAADAVQVLRQINRVAKLGYVILDLRRNRIATLFTRLFAMLAIRNPAFRTDAIKSTRAAFSFSELSGMAQTAGLKNHRIERCHACFHVLIEGIK